MTRLLCTASNNLAIIETYIRYLKLLLQRQSMPTPTAALPDSLVTTPAPHRGAHRWLLFVHQLPASPSNLRVRTWRRLQQIGAVPVKQAVYVLPNTPAAREDFEWLTTEVEGAGGDASVFAADSIDTFSDDALVDEFRRARQDAYGALAQEIERVLSRVNARRRPRGTRAPAVHRLIDGFRDAAVGPRAHRLLRQRRT